MPHHSFAVFCVYPWTGLLGDDRKAKHALTVLDRCRIRWGKVTAVQDDQAVVECRPLCWDGRLLTLGEPVTETARLALDGSAIAHGIGPGDWVSLHWDWICERLTERQATRPARFHDASSGPGQPPRRAPRDAGLPRLTAHPAAAARTHAPELVANPEVVQEAAP